MKRVRKPQGKTIAFFEVEQWMQDYLAHNLPDHELVFDSGPLTDENLAKAKNADIVAVFIHSIIARHTLQKLAKLRLLTTMSTGYDHIDIAACTKHRIIVTNVPSYGENTVAEHAMGLLLMISRRLHDSVDRTRRGNWELEGLRGFDLKGKTCGVIGTGRIGKHFAAYAKAFGMKLLGYDKYPAHEWARELGLEYVQLDKLLAASDVISLHLPYLPETHHMINRNNIRKLKKGCVVINTARGALMATDALLLGLEKGYIKAFGTDVLEEEEIIKDDKKAPSTTFEKKFDAKTALGAHILLEQDNVYVTPHNAFNSPEALQRILDTTLENISGFMKGKTVNIVKEGAFGK